MGNGVSREKYGGRLLPPSASAHRPAAGSECVDRGPACGNSKKNNTSDNDGFDDQRPIPLHEGDGKAAPWNSATVSLDNVLGPPDSTTSLYRKKEAIGKGAFGEAYIVERNASHPLPPRHHLTEERGLPEARRRLGDEGPRQFVAKVMNLTSMSQNDRRYAQTEIMCLACNHHFAIIQYYEHFFIDDEDQTIVIITEFADQGDLYRNLYKHNVERYLSEREVGMFFVQLLLGLDHIHSRRMIHRDIKTANIFLTSRGFLKLGDFGFSQQYDSTVSNPIACTFLGTSYYLAPEMWKGQRYGKKADIWAAGVVLCELLGKRRPFEADSLSRMKEVVLSGSMWLPAVHPDDNASLQSDRIPDEKTCYISREMREFLQQILQQNPEKRPSAAQLLKTPLMQHYLCVFQKHVNRMIAMDDALEEEYKSSPDNFVGSLPNYLLSAEERALVLKGIAEGEEVINLETEREIATSTSPRMESVVYKESGGGQWKERYLILADGFLTMTLTKGKVAAGTGERSKKVPLETIKSVVPMILDTPVTAEITGQSGTTQLRCAFAISTQSSQSIMFATATEEERDQWLSALIVALKMD
ncbi:protein kinase [Trypanosoma grayi]|uniref:protein kinase n=1 Tax=Trypanosoma grayi TaxID=71804 RepID=UPI0004F4BAFC|nr:protein kinase [Trypanosoma grayi]KEG14864.1 protein kinase [Trypanosoma grayi]